ncbi:phage tail domain-containing protein [Pseudarcicella hirudinis]|uniref:phage tail domain-containing protein n=1 Tax=Pseudarcicella hirudinis TaxID=1079859 RepID=UPI0035E724FD
MEIDGRYNLPATKSQQFTAYSSEGYQITKRTFREITLKCLIVESDLNAFQTRINSLSKLFAKEGLRTITYRHDALRTFFCKKTVSGNRCLYNTI